MAAWRASKKQKVNTQAMATLQRACICSLAKVVESTKLLLSTLYQCLRRVTAAAAASLQAGLARVLGLLPSILHPSLGLSSGPMIASAVYAPHSAVQTDA